jgi:hypothetical protein
MFGTAFFTPRARDMEFTGYQVTCGNPRHHRCTKEMSFKVGGPDTKLMLMCWVAWGTDLPDKESHKLLWELVAATARLGELPSEEELRLIVEDVVVMDAAPPQKRRRLSPHRAPVDVLGGPTTETPAAVHDRMLALAHAEELPMTTPQQRKRYSKSVGITYGVPPHLSDALAYGYLHPCLPAPSNYYWKYKSKECVLARRGG